MLLDGFQFLLKGGPMMWPLFACAVVSLAVLIERFVFLRGVVRGSRGLAQDVRIAIRQDRATAALKFLDMRPGPIARVLKAAIENRQCDRKQIEAAIEEVALEETPVLSRNLNVLDTVITIAPLLGLLGTVTGMIKAFQVVAISSGLTAPAAITSGVAEALIATASGLAIAIVTLVGYNSLTEQVKRVVSEMEIAATKTINEIDSARERTEGRYEAAKV